MMKMLMPGAHVSLVMLDIKVDVGYDCVLVGSVHAVLIGCTVLITRIPIDVSSADVFICSSLAPVRLFRRGMSSVGNVLRGMREKFFGGSVGVERGDPSRSSGSHAIPGTLDSLNPSGTSWFF